MRAFRLESACNRRVCVWN